MQLIPENRDLEERIRNFLRWERRLDFFTAAGFVLWILPTMTTVIVTSALNLELTPYVTTSLLGIGIIVSIALWRFSWKRIREYPVDDSEWAQFYTSLIYNNLQMYFANKNSVGMSRKYREKALKNAKSFLSCIEKRWTIRSFELVSYVEYLIFQVKNDMRYRIIPALEKGSDEVLVRLAQIVYDFHYYSKPLSIENLKLLNEHMSSKEDTKLPSTEAPGLDTLVSRFLAFLRKSTMERHALVVFASFNVSFWA